MARSIDEIQQEIIAVKNETPELAGLDTDSRRGIWRAFTRVVATVMSFFEQKMDVFVAEVETIQAKSQSATQAWIQDRVFRFQYNEDNPQVVQVAIDLTVDYPTIDATLRIVSRCSVKSNLSNVVKIQTAKNEPPEALISDEISALQGYINVICPPGITYLVSSANPDRIYVDADIYYQGQYSAVIVTNVKNAIINFLSLQSSQTNFSGQIKISALENVIRDLTGVNDVVMKNVKARASITDFVDATDMVKDNQLVLRSWNTIAGYIIPEDETGYTLDDSLNFISE